MITIWYQRLVEIDLYNVAARSPQALADLSEQSYAQRVDYAAQKVQLSGAKIVMLTGPSAAARPPAPLRCKGSAKARDSGAGGQSG